MASQEESPFRGLMTSWPALAAMGVTMLSFLAASPRLESPRPTTGGAVPKLRIKDPEAPTRLWQDPLTSVVVNGPPQENSAVLARNMPEVRPGEEKKVLVLLALIEGDPNPEQTETRRRERYATLSALQTAGYVPVKSDRLSYVDLEYTDEGNRPIAQGKNIIPQLGDNRVRVPFEWVRPTDDLDKAGPRTRYDGVCIAWLYDIDALNLLHLLVKLKEQIKDALFGVTCEFAITGRIVSARLRKMLGDDARLRDSVNLNGVTLYITSSTTPSVHQSDKDHALPLKKSGLERKYVIGSDDLLLSRLVQELERRNVSTSEDHLAIISEWDTLYGQSMPAEFKKAVKEWTGQDPQQTKYFSYLRGLDGKLPGKAEEDDKASKAAKPGDAPADKPSAVNGEGDAQIDYLRRLIERMQAMRKPFRAIGILGSDVYDKLLILKAMRTSFPGAVFFTTDLDARMLQPAESAWTRNLVIASHFGLALDKKYQDRIPPFRSSYDSASYLGCLMAVRCPLLDEVQGAPAAGDHLLELREKDKIVKVPLPVHLYEVGRNGAFELTAYRPDQDPLGARNYQRDREFFDQNRGRIIFVAVAGLALLCLLLLTVSRTWQRLFHLQPAERADDSAAAKLPWRGPFVMGVLIAAIAAAVAIVYAHYEPGEEVFAMVEGISMWPTILFRLFAIALSVYYVLKTLEDLADRDHKIRKEFFAPPEPDQTDAPASVIPEPRSWLRATFGMWLWNPDHDKDSVRAVWQQFQDLGRWRNRLLRYLLVFGANVVLFLLLHTFFPWGRPRGRGDIAHWSSVVSLYVSGVMLVSLLLFVVDTTVLCYRFVTYLSRFRGEWEAPLLEAQAEQRGLPPIAARTDPAHAALGQLLRMRLIAMTTRVVSDLIFYPFVVLFVLFVAQNPLFVTWQWNIPVLAVAGLSAGGALACALIFQRSAKEAQRKAIDRLDDLLLPSAGKENDEARGKLMQIRADIDAMDSGVFSGFAQNPLVYAVLLPLGGGGGLAALEALLPHL